MNRARFNFAVDVAAFLSLAAVSATGVLMKFVLPPGSGRWAAVWGLDRHQWGEIHFWAAMVFFFLLLIHLTLHIRWLVCMARGGPREGSGARLALGLLALLIFLFAAFSPLFAPVEIREEEFGRGWGSWQEKFHE